MAASAVKDPFGLVGAVLHDEYRVDAVVGEGGFGVVYRGLHLGLEQPIAIKVLKGLELEDPRMQELLFAKFKDEAKLLYTLSQQSLTIVRSMDFGALTTPSGAWAPFMVLEWLDGRSLSDDLAERRRLNLRGRSVEDALAMLEPAAQGLSVAHARRIAHRDVKPGNLFLLRESLGGPRMKVLDFGIAKMMKEGEQAGTKGTFASFTWLYASPEQLDPRIGSTGLATDVYAFALVLTELLTDRPPVDGRDVVTILKSATDPSVRPTPRSKGATNVPDAIELACRRALAVDPAARFPTVAELWKALTGGFATTPRRMSTVAVPSVTGPLPAAPAPQNAPMPPSVVLTGPPRGTPPPHAAPMGPPPGHAPTPPPFAAPMQIGSPSWTGPAPSPPLGTVPPGTAFPTGTHRRPPMPPRPGETSSVVSVAIVLFVLAVLFAGSCAALHQAC